MDPVRACVTNPPPPPLAPLPHLPSHIRSFAAFEEAGLDNEEAVRETGRRYRETVMAMGGGKHPSDVFRAFRGRDPSPEALLRHQGLTPKTK